MRVFAGNRKDRMFHNKDFTDLLYEIKEYKIYRLKHRLKGSRYFD